MTETRIGRGRRPAPLLTETAAALWPDARRIVVTRRPRRPADAVDHLVLPRPGAPRWILPLADRGATAALGAHEEGRARRAAAAVVGAAHRGGALGWLPLPRLRVEGPGESVVSVLAAASGVGDAAVVALRLGSWDCARSVVARILDADGATRAFGKVGIDDHGRASVAAEAGALQRIEGLGLQAVRAPRPVHRATWRDLQVLVVSPLVAPAPRAGARMPVAAMRELAGASGSREATLSASGWWRRTSHRIAQVGDASRRARLEAAARRLDAMAAGLPLPLGLSHGDWTAWNMAWDGDSVLLWDWEHFAEDVPVGFDQIHYLAQELRVTRGTDSDAEQEWRRRADSALADDLDLDPVRRDVVRAAYLLDVNVRYLLDRQGTAAADQPRAGWGLPLLESETAPRP